MANRPKHTVGLVPGNPTTAPGGVNEPGSVAVPKGAVWSTALLALIRAPATPANYQFLNQWAIREHGSDQALFANNPFFTTAGGRGSVGVIKAGSYPLIPDSAFGPGRSNTAGVPAYPNIATGVWITAYHLTQQYPSIVAALRTGNPASQATNPGFQRELTSWSGGGYDGFQSIAAQAGPVGPTLDGSVRTNQPPSGGGGSILGSIGGAISGLPGDVAGGANSLIRHVPGVAQAESVAGFIGKLTDPSYLLRGLQILAGAALVGGGVFLLARQVALAADVPDVTKAVPGAAAAAALA